MERIVITKAILGICHMQVCCERDATDKEILEVCNWRNPSGTQAGWTTVIRDDSKMGPVQCQAYPDRIHMLISC